MSLLRACALLSLVAALLPAAGTLDIYFADVEGTRAMLVTTPSGEALLLDAGWEGLNDDKWVITQPDDRDTDRIIEVVKLSKVKHIDHLVITHYDNDHAGNVRRLVSKLPVPVREFVDHGPPVGSGKALLDTYNSYLAAVGKSKRISVKPGDVIPMRGLVVRVLSSADAVIKDSLPGAGAPNQFCAAPEKPERGENPASIGLLFRFGEFRMIDLADLTRDKEFEMMCPRNRVGTVDLFVVSHHGYNWSNSPELVDALRPKVAILTNGAKKGGEAEAWQTVRKSPGLEDIWQLHYTVDVGDANNAPEEFIANPQKEPDPKCFGAVLGDQARWIKVSAQTDGTFTVTNSRNGKSKTYKRLG
jgi:competence protein ComEC